MKDNRSKGELTLARAEKVAKILIGKSVKDAKDFVSQANLRLQVINRNEPTIALFQPDLVKVEVIDGKVTLAWV